MIWIMSHFAYMCRACLHFRNARWVAYFWSIQFRPTSCFLRLQKLRSDFWVNVASYITNQIGRQLPRMGGQWCGKGSYWICYLEALAQFTIVMKGQLVNCKSFLNKIPGGDKMFCSRISLFVTDKKATIEKGSFCRNGKRLSLTIVRQLIS